MILVIDNYDSFTYNIVQLMGELGATIEVVRNDQVTVDEVRAMAPDQIIISPGPGYPRDAGISRDVIYELGPSIPLLGVCLGHQCIGEVYGGVVSHAQSLMHGKTSMVYHKLDDLYTGVPSPFEATRYHSLVIKEETMPDCLYTTSFTEDGEIMGVRHKEYPVMGVQFHPESILTGFGKRILQNFMEFKVPVRG
ncbi:MAG: anthranilate/aminodeoxychorismate synthase component II [Anaerolineaceae bacterium]|nr:anthranilate/aminodeoxychorismate synthase component II [Anaerolineaceae bacterium]